MKLRNLAFTSLKILVPFLLLCGTSFGAITSYDNVFTANDQYASDFTTKLNRNFSQSLTGGINNVETANITNGTILAEDMATSASPVTRTLQGAVCSNFVYTGLLPQTSSGTLTSNITAGTGYPLGNYITKASNTAHTWTASKWTWTDIDTNGDFHYTETAFGAAAPAVYANSMRLALVSSDTAQVNTVTDMRVTSCTTGPFSIIADATGESNLSDMFKWGNGGFHRGLVISSKDANGVYLYPGSAWINGEYRTLSAVLSVPLNSAGSSTVGISGLDTGSVAASTTYYLYGAADMGSVKPITGIFSSNPTTPSGVTNFRKFGEVTTDSGKGLTASSADIATIAYEGLIRQTKKFTTGEYAIGTVAVPDDDTIPLVSEGNPLMQMTFTPVGSVSHLKIDVVANIGQYAATNASYVVALYKDGADPAIGSIDLIADAAYNYGTQQAVFTSYIYPAGQLNPMTFSVRGGGNVGANFTFNGHGNIGGRRLGGNMASSITVTEFE